jgi:hypothetical protein
MESIHLTASEKGYFWVSYMVDSMAVCYLSYFLENEKNK